MMNFFSPKAEANATICPQCKTTLLRWMVITLTVTGIVWLSIASYYYWAIEDGAVYHGALFTGIMSVLLSVILAYLEEFYARKTCKHDSFGRFIIENQHILDGIYQKAKGFANRKLLTGSAGAIVVVLTTIYLMGVARGKMKEH